MIFCVQHQRLKFVIVQDSSNAVIKLGKKVFILEISEHKTQNCHGFYD